MFFKKKHTAADEVLDIINRIQVNIENNYKDLALDAFKESSERFEKLKNEGSLSAKEISKIDVLLKEYEKKLDGYSHRMKLNW